MFFGTPHRGLDTENFRIMQQDNHHIEAKVLDSLSRDSPHLDEKLDMFKNCLKDRKVVSFFEERSTKSLIKVLYSVALDRGKIIIQMEII